MGEQVPKTVRLPSSRDAVIVVPGIMGSELVESASGKTIWGLADLPWYVSAWTTGASLRTLQVTDDERAGRVGRVRATRLLRFPAFLPVLQGFEPYSTLLKRIREVVCHPDAVSEFPYDWRLSIAYNARLLAETAHRHLTSWRNHPAQNEARRGDSDGREARLVIVAHSMGGLLARYLSLIPGATEGVRTTITLGTPFYGAVKAAVMLNSGRGAPVPLPRHRLRELSKTLPGVHDLLPIYRCVDGETTARRLTASDVADLGGDPDLAKEAMEMHDQLAKVRPVGHEAVLGVRQPTAQSLRLRNGVVEPLFHSCRPGANEQILRENLAGDGTVHTESATLPDMTAMPLAQSHGAIAATDEAITVVCHAITGKKTGPWLGAGELGLDVPDVVAASGEWMAKVTGIDHPGAATCRVFDVSTNHQVDMPRLQRRGEVIAAPVSLPTPGLYRLEVISGGMSAVRQIVLAVDGADAADQ